GRGVVTRTVGVVGGVETELAESLARVVASADSARMDVHDRIPGPQHRLVVDTVGGAEARTEILGVSLNRSPAVAVIGAVADEVEAAQMTAGGRVGQRWIEVRHQIVDFLERPHQVPAQPEVECEARIDLKIILNVRGVTPVPAAGFSYRVLADAAAVDRA